MLSIIHKTDSSSLTAIQEEMAVRKTSEFFILFGFGSQTDGLIFMMLSKIGVFCVLANPKTMTQEDVLRLKEIGLLGIIGSGGPYSVYSKTEPVPFDCRIFELNVPIFGICLFFQLICQYRGGIVSRASISECNPQGIVNVLDYNSPLFAGIPHSFKAGFSHGDEVSHVEGFDITAISNNAIIAAAEMRHHYGVQFHPEVSHSEYGQKIFENFCFGICGAKDRFPVRDVAARKVAALRDLVGDDDVVIALSGGVDSSVSCELLRRAKAGRQGQIHAVYIKGLDRYLDEEHLRKYFPHQHGFVLYFVDASPEFLTALKGKEGGAEKRRAMKGVYVALLEQKIKETGATWLASGTNYADISESRRSLADIAPNTIQLLPRGESVDTLVRKDVIKEHHNVGNTHTVPEVLPVVDMVKDTIRDLGRELGMPEELLMKQPFPGPGLAVRIDGEITAEKLAIERELDRIWDEELTRAGLASEIWQYGADLLRSEVTTSRGDGRGKGLRAELWAKVSVNGFTAEPYLFEPAFLRKVAVRITSEIRAIGSVGYDFTPKPPKTIEQS